VPGRPVSSPAVSEDLLFLEQAEQVTALHTSDGSIAWTQNLSGPLVAPLVWENGWLIGATKATLYGVHSGDGSPGWTHDLSSPPRSSPALFRDRLFVSSDDGYVRAYRLGSGELLWEHRVGGKPTEILALEERLYVGSTDNFLYCLFTKDGVEDWHWRTGADVLTRAAFDDSRIYFVSYDNLLRALNQKSGAQVWKRPLTFRPIWPPMRAADTVVVAGIAGSPRAFFIKDGTPAGDMGIGPATEIAAPIHVFTSPASYGPVVLAVTRSLAKGASLTAVSRAVEPPTLAITPLPGIIPVVAPRTTF
jgi:outer membrane protein assembly factor BamB